MSPRHPSGPSLSSPSSTLRTELQERLRAGLEPAWPSVADYLRSALEGENCSISLQHGSLPHGSLQHGSLQHAESHEVVGLSGASPEWVLRYEERIAEINPYLAEARRRRPQGGEAIVSAADALVPFSAVKGSAYFHEFCAPLRLNDAVGCLLFEGRRPLGHIAIRRASGRARYGAAEEARLRLATDLLGEAFLRSIQLRSLRAHAAAGEHLALEQRAGIVLFDDRGEVLEASGLGGTVLEQHAGALASAVRSFAADPSERSEGALPGSSLRELRYVLHRVPIEGRARVLCMLREESRASSVPLPAGLHFTARERDVVELLATGLDNRSIARSLGIGVYTTKDHVKSVFRKLSVRNRAQAVAILAGARTRSVSAPVPGALPGSES
jgi:DNA-binding CsgD family transcriptional regulator